MNKNNMELERDLLKKDEKSLFRIILGILLFVISIVWVLIHKEVIRPFDWLYSGSFALGGIIHIVEGLGLFSFDRIFGKAYILINSELILLKPSVFNKEQSVYWNNIKSIDYKPNKLKIETIDDTNVIINLSLVSFLLKQEIRRTIDCIAKEKNIKSNV